jgi:fused signal recognition particle receptor
VTDLSALLPFIIAVIVLFIVAGSVIGLVRGRRSRVRYTDTRDANDPVLAPNQPNVARSDTGAPTAVAEPPAPTLEAEPGVQVPEAFEEPVAEVVPTETPAPVAGRLQRLRERLARSNNVLGKGLLALLSSDRIDDNVWDEVEETLLLADIGTEPSLELVDTLKDRVKVMGSRNPDEVRAMLRDELVKLVDPSLDRSLNVDRKAGKPAVVLVVGVNGVGKTTTVGKLARVLVAEDKDVILGAADTFRAAAAEQLATWGARVGVPTVKSDVDGADPASVAFEAVKAGIEQEVDVVMVDTAGRLQNKVGLMDELGKVKRVIEKQAEVDEVLLVLDATTGQNGLNQAKVFSEVVDITGIVLTKLDGTAKGGIVVAIQKQLGVPVKLVGLGEGPDDLAPFDVEGFVDAILA